MSSHTLELQQLYVAYFTRPAEPNGLVYWSNVLDHDANALPRITVAFASSSEYQAGIAGKNNAQVVDTVYQHLFGRAGEAAGITYWADLLDRHVLTIGNLVTAVAKVALTTDLFAFNAKVTVATAVTTAIDTPTEILAYTGTKNTLAGIYISKVVDQASFDAAIDPASIQQLIDSFSPPYAVPFGFASPVELVGLPHHDAAPAALY